jgi:hypothetical protein
MSDSKTHTTTSNSSLTDVSEQEQQNSSLSNDIEHISQLLTRDFPDDDAADQDITTLLQQLERADSIGQKVEGKIDAILDKLDHLLGTLQRDGDSRTVDSNVQVGMTTSQKEGGGQ